MERTLLWMISNWVDFTHLCFHTGMLTALKYMSRWSGQHHFCASLEARRCQHLCPHHFSWILLGWWQQMSFGKADVGPKGCYILIAHFRILLTSVSVSVKQICCQCSPFMFLWVAGLAAGGTWHHCIGCCLSCLLNFWPAAAWFAA